MKSADGQVQIMLQYSRAVSPSVGSSRFVNFFTGWCVASN